MYQEHYRATESNGHNTDVGAEEDDDEDTHELQRERVEMVRISGRGLHVDEAPVITRFYNEQNYQKLH